MKFRDENTKPKPRVDDIWLAKYSYNKSRPIFGKISKIKITNILSSLKFNNYDLRGYNIKDSLKTNLCFKTSELIRKVG
jgi:hypothetical protein